MLKVVNQNKTIYTPTDSTYTKLLLHGNNLKDYSGNGHVVTANGDASYNNSGNPFGHGGVFTVDNDGDYFAAPTSSDFGFAGDFVVAGFVKFTGVGRTLHTVYSTTEAGGIHIYWDGGVYNAENWRVSNRIDNQIDEQWGIPVIGQWYHFACVRSGTTLSFYIDGTRIAYSTFSTAYSDGVCNIGGVSGSDSDSLNGSLVEMLIIDGSDNGWTGSTIDVPTKPYALGNVFIDSVANFSYDNKTYDFSAKSDILSTIVMNSGVKMYATNPGNFFNKIYQYSLSTPYDVSTATFDTKEFSVGEDAWSIFMKSDGSKYIGIGLNELFSYSMSTSWDISTSSITDTKSVTEDTHGRGLFVSSDGLKLWTLGFDNRTVYYYTMSSAWDVSTLTYSGDSLLVYSLVSGAYGLTFNSAGTELYISGATLSKVFQYNLSTAWDVTSATDSGYSVATVAPASIQIVDDNKMYLTYLDAVYQYSR